MSRWIRPVARPFVDDAARAVEEPWRSVEALQVLETELTSARRLGGGLLALLIVGATGLGAGLTSYVDGAARVVVAIIALALAAAAAWLGRDVLADGRAVVSAHRAWSAVDDRPIGAGSVFAGQLTARSILRTALGAAALLAAIFSWSLVYLGLAGGDPADLGDGRATAAVMGLIWAIGLSVAAWCLISVELRAGRARSRRVIRGR